MSVSASIKFAQGATTDVAGRALIGALSPPAVVATNGNNTNVADWHWVFLDTPPGSTVPKDPLGIVPFAAGNVPSISFTADVRGGYLLQLTTRDLAGNVAVDRRTFQVPEASGRIIPPFRATDAMLNFAGETRGWSPIMETWLQYLDTLSGGGGGVPGFLPATPPPLVSALTWVNQGTATATDDVTDDTLLVTAEFNASAWNTHMLVKALPATPYTFTIGFHPNLDPFPTAPLFGIVLRESSTGKLVHFFFYYNAAVRLAVYRYTSPSAQSTVYSDVAFGYGIGGYNGGPLWLRVTDDGTNLTWYWSNNGKEYYRFTGPTSRIDFLAGGPNQLGIVFDCFAGAGDAAKVKSRLFHWLETSP